MFLIYAEGDEKGDLEPELSVKSRISQTKSCVLVTAFDESILFITNLVAGDISLNTRRNHALPPRHQVLIAVRFYASGSFRQVIVGTFNVDKSTVSRVIADVSRALIVKQPHFIKWPSTNDERATIKNAFYLRGGFPCVIGCVDGTHVRLQVPSEHENSHVNRKGFHSINVQGVCNHEGE